MRSKGELWREGLKELEEVVLRIFLTKEISDLSECEGSEKEKE